MDDQGVQVTTQFKKCILCGAENPDDYSLLYRTNQCEVSKCMHCGLVYNSLTFVHAENGTDPMWEDDVESGIYHREKIKEAFEAEFKNRLKDIETHVPKGRILDIGCGFGYFLCMARSQGWDTYGVDTWSKAVQLTRRKFNLRVRHATVAKANFEADFFDVVTMWDVIEHIPEPLVTLSEIRRILKKGGLLVIKTPNEDGFFKKVAYLLHKLSGGLIRFHLKYLYHASHLYSFSPHTIRMLLEQSGFKLIQIFPDETNYSFAKAQVLAHYSGFGEKKKIRELLVLIALPLAFFLARILRMRNKMVICAQKS